MAAQGNDLLVAERSGIRGTISVSDIVALAGAGGSLNVTTAPLFEHRDMWAEEASSIAGVTAEWSYGNGATGFVGLVFTSGWEVIEMAFNADTFAATSTCTIELCSYVTPSNAAANKITDISMANSTDGGGATNNAYKHVVLPTPIAVPAGPVGFLTRSVVGSISDVRVYARFRRQIGDYVTGVSIT